MTDEEQTFGVSPAAGDVSPTPVPNVSPPPTDEVSPNGDNKKRVDVKLPASVRPALDALRKDDETDAAILKRLVESAPTLAGQVNDLTSDLEYQRAANKDIREQLKIEQQRYIEKFDEQVHEIGQLRAQVATLTNTVETGLVPAGGQATLDSFGIKDTVEEAREMCGDDDTCMKVAGKMMDLKAHFASKAMDHDHDAEQKQLTRDHDMTQRQIELVAKKEAQAEDRALKTELAEKDHENKLELQLAKKGGFRKELLEDIVFLGSGSVKRPGKTIAEKKRRAFHAAKDDDDDGSWLNDEPMDEETLDMHEEFDESEI